MLKKILAIILVSSMISTGTVFAYASEVNNTTNESESEFLTGEELLIYELKDSDIDGIKKYIAMFKEYTGENVDDLTATQIMNYIELYGNYTGEDLITELKLQGVIDNIGEYSDIVGITGILYKAEHYYDDKTSTVTLQEGQNTEGKLQQIDFNNYKYSDGDINSFKQFIDTVIKATVSDTTSKGKVSKTMEKNKNTIIKFIQDMKKNKDVINNIADKDTVNDIISLLKDCNIDEVKKYIALYSEYTGENIDDLTFGDLINYLSLYSQYINVDLINELKLNELKNNISRYGNVTGISNLIYEAQKYAPNYATNTPISEIINYKDFTYSDNMVSSFKSFLSLVDNVKEKEYASKNGKIKTSKIIEKLKTAIVKEMQNVKKEMNQNINDASGNSTPESNNSTTTKTGDKENIPLLFLLCGSFIFIVKKRKYNL